MDVVRSIFWFTVHCLFYVIMVIYYLIDTINKHMLTDYSLTAANKPHRIRWSHLVLIRKKIRSRLFDKLGHWIEEIIRRHKSVFMANNRDIGCTELVTHHIVTKGIPINTKQRWQTLHLEDKIEETIKNLHDNIIIKMCNSPWYKPMVSVWKKGKQEVRLCLDFWRK